MTFFHLHVHSMYSVLDGMPRVPEMVAKAVKNGQPGLGLTDHGVMSGVAELYSVGRESGLKTFPGEEFYIVRDVLDKEAKRYHIGLLAMNAAAYEALLRLSSLSHTRERYHYRPRIEFSDLARLSMDDDVRDGLICLTGCWFGLLHQSMIDSYNANNTLRSVVNPKSAAIAVGVQTVEMLKAWIPNTFIEVQNHNTPKQQGVDEATFYDLLWGVSEATKTPMMATQDAHYLEMSQKPVHDLMKKIGYIGSDDATFPGDSYHLATTQWVRSHFSDELWESSEAVMATLLDRHDLEIPVLNKYRYYVPKIGKNPDDWLTAKTTHALRKYMPGDREYRERLLHERRIIRDLGMTGYFRLIHQGVEFARKEGIYIRARGSANGSLVCYLLGITSVDPIQWNLQFERFLSPDRKKPPDIDLDIEDTRRDEIVEFYRQAFQVVQIGTFSTLGENEFGSGSVLVQYLSQQRRELGDKFKGRLGHVKYMDDLPDQELAGQLHDLAAMRVKKAPGAHAAGFVVGTRSRPIQKHIPTMLIPSSGSTVTQFTMDDIERLGYIKIDLLGQRTLTTIKRTLELIGQDPAEGLDWIPYDDPHTMRELRKGIENSGLFQLEGWTAARGCREMKVKNTEDIIRLNALYRPATIKTGYKDLYLHNRINRSVIEYPPHPAFPKHLKSTFGVAIFQEQVLSILREIGVPYEELNAFLSALKMSNDKSVRAREIFADHRKRFIDLCKSDHGLSSKDAQECWDAISGFAGYGFNRAHSAAYGLLGYQAAYLKTHHTMEYMAALLETSTGSAKEPLYIAEARRLKIDLLAADVNRSGVEWRLDPKGIRKGLVSIKGVGRRAAESIVENAPFTDVDDLIERTDSRAVTGGKSWAKGRTLNGVMETLRRAGALRQLGLDD